ncbi:MAG TPA: hypothetical protein ENK67_06705 [Flavobacteriia bacterium]|nr:hypothetical protein [Flavobacteriia bacterium]
MSVMTKLILVNLGIVVISLLILYPLYLYFLKDNPNNYLGMLFILGYLILRPRAKIIKYQSEDKVEIKWFRKKWEI